jgi:NADH dehydrogenase
LAAPAIAAPIRSLFRSQGNLTTLLAEVVQIDAPGQQVLLSDGSSLVFDHLVVATGATHSYFGHDEWEQHAPGLKTLEDAFAEVARQTLIGEFRRIDPHHARILLLEVGPRVLQAMPADLSAKALTQLQKLGVEVRLNSIVTNLDSDGLKVRGPLGVVVLAPRPYLFFDRISQSPRRHAGLGLCLSEF